MKPKAPCDCIAQALPSPFPDGSPLAQLPALLTLRQVVAITAMSRSTLYNKLRADEFVRPVKTGVRSIRFLEPEVRKWIEQRVALRDAEERSL